MNLVKFSVLAVVSLVIMSCGGSGNVTEPLPTKPVEIQPTTIPSPTSKPVPTPTQIPPSPTPAPTATPTATPTPAPTATPTATPTPAPTATPTPTPTPTATPTPTPIVRGFTYNKYGFTFRLDEEQEIKAFGYTETEANNKQGLLSLKYDGANIIVIWIQQVDATPEAMLKDTYQVVKNSSKTLSFVAVSEGDITISKQQGRFGSLIATDASGKAAGGALIGSMVCKNTNTALSLTVTSGNATTLQVRFDRLIKGLECPA